MRQLLTSSAGSTRQDRKWSFKEWITSNWNPFSFFMHHEDERFIDEREGESKKSQRATPVLRGLLPFNSTLRAQPVRHEDLVVDYRVD